MCELKGVPVGPYNIAYCALNTFAHLTRAEQQLAMLGAVKALLVQHGILVLDLTPPWPHLLPPSMARWCTRVHIPTATGRLCTSL